MAQHDHVLDNADGATFRVDANGALAAIATMNSGGTAPVTTYAGLGWWDTTNNLIKRRNGANTAWVIVAAWDGVTFIPYANAVALDAVAQTDIAQSFTKPQRGASSPLGNITGTVTLDLNTAQDFDGTTTGSITIVNPSNIASALGQKGSFIIDNAAAFALIGLGTYWKRVDTIGAPTLPTGICRFDFHVVSATRIEYRFGGVEA